MPKATISPLTSATGWSVTGAGNSVTAQTWPNLSTSYLTGQLLFSFAVPGIASLDLSSSPVSLANPNFPGTYFQNFSLSIKAQTGETIGPPVFDANTGSGFRGKIRFFNGGTSLEYYLPLPGLFQPVTFYNNGPLTQITRIEIECTASAGVNFFASELIAYTDQFPFDVYGAVKAALDQNAITIQCGTTTCSTGAKSITITNPRYIDKYATIQIGSEQHQIISDVADGVVSFGKAFGGPAITGGPYTNAPVYLVIPTTITPDEFDALIPGISITGAKDPELVESDEFYSPLNDSFGTSGNVRTRYNGPTWKYTVLIEGMSRADKIDELIMQIIKRTCNGASIVYTNGRRHEMIMDRLVSPDYGDASEILSKIQCEVTIEVCEEQWTQEIQVTGFPTLTKTVTASDPTQFTG